MRPELDVVSELRSKAGYCRREAASALSEEVRAEWLELAADCLAMAERLESQAMWQLV